MHHPKQRPHCLAAGGAFVSAASQLTVPSIVPVVLLRLNRGTTAIAQPLIPRLVIAIAPRPSESQVLERSVPVLAHARETTGRDPQTTVGAEGLAAHFCRGWLDHAHVYQVLKSAKIIRVAGVQRSVMCVGGGCDQQVHRAKAGLASSFDDRGSGAGCSESA